MNEDTSLRQRVNDFFENPSTPFAYAVQGFIVLLILASVGIFVADFWFHDFYVRYESFFFWGNNVILVLFTIEYLLRLFTAPKKLRFMFRPMSIIDFLAIFPNYVELILPLVVDTTELRVFRLVRLLRFARLLRTLKFIRYGNIFKKVFSYRKTILQNITPVIAFFVVLKGIIWILESYGLWIADPQLGNLFSIIGFALGIILGQKISVSYQKFTEVEEAVVRLRSTLWSLEGTLNAQEKGLGTSVCAPWARVFLELLKSPKVDTRRMNAASATLRDAVTKVEKMHADIANIVMSIVQDADLCLSKKVRLTPKPYDTLLHQSTMLYLALVVAFIPGLTGMISVILATYMLYGMYNLTQDFDSIIGGEYDLINLDLSELEEFAAAPAHTVQ